MNTERELGHFICHQLNLGTVKLDKPIADRLFAARQAALNHQAGRVSELSLAGMGRNTLFWCEDNLRPMLLAASLVLAVACGNYLMSMQRTSDIEDIDSALLTDDLPINAYLDNGFRSWLADTSQR